MHPKFSLSVLFLAVSFAPVAPSTRASDYEPYLPKTSPTRSIVIVDLARDKAGHDWRAVEALVADQIIQGIVNRDSPEKIYFVNNKRRWNGEWNPWPMDSFALKDGMIPVPQTRARLDPQKKFPALSWLLQHYRDRLKGRIRIRSLGEKDERFAGPDGGVMAALTAAGQLDALVVSPELERYLQQEGIDLPLLEDTTALHDHLEAFTWAYDHFFRSTTTRKFVGKLSWNNFGNFPPRFAPTTIDYFIANRAFILDLNANVPAESAAMTRLLNSANYVPGTPVLGDIDWETTELDRIAELGYFFNFMVDGPNYTVTSSFPSDPARISTPAFPRAAPVTPDTVYVAFYVTDGDNLSFSYYVHSEAWMTSPAAGQTPIGWSYNPLLFDLFPTQLEWFSKHNHGQTFELVSNFNNGRPAKTSSTPAVQGFERFAALLRNYLDHTNGVFPSINNLGDPVTAGRLYQALSAPRFGFSGYARVLPDEPWRTTAPAWQLLPNGTPTTELIGATQREATPDGIAQQIQTIAAGAPAHQPLFLLAGAGESGFSGDSAQLAANIKTRLNAAPGRHRFEFLRPVDLATTWLASQGLPHPEVFEAETLEQRGFDTRSQANASGGVAILFPKASQSLVIPSVATKIQCIAVRYTNPSGRALSLGIYSDDHRLATITCAPTPDLDTYARAEVRLPAALANATLTLRGDESASGPADPHSALLDQISCEP